MPTNIGINTKDRYNLKIKCYCNIITYIVYNEQK